MKKVININFQGRVVMIEEEAYENLKKYIDSLRRHFANEEGCDEIINDIENRISELFADVIKKGSPCVSEDDLDAIIKSIGRPEDFEDEEETSARTNASTSSEKQSEQAFQQTATGERKQFFRDETHKKLGGVCAGIANYFNIDVTWIRLFALVLLVFYGIGFIPYIILWIALPSSATQVIGSSQKRLYRDLSHKTIGGVCAGLANYFGVNIWIPKVVFLAGAVCTFPVLILSSFHSKPIFFPGMNGFFVTLYIILWAVVPAAVTASERLSMKGENVDLNSIKNTVQEDLNDDKKGKKKVKNFSAMNNSTSHSELIPVKDHSTLGTIIITLFKVFAYFILGCILIGVISSLFGIGVAGFSIYPLKGYIIGGVYQNTLALLSLILFVWLPVVGIIIWIIRALVKSKRNIYLRTVFIVLWLIGLVSTVLLAFSIYKSISYVNNPFDEQITLSTPKSDRLEINCIRQEYPFRFSRFWIFGSSSYSINSIRVYRSKFPLFNRSPYYIEDSVLINNTRIHIIQSSNDSFNAVITKLSDGSSPSNADELAGKIHYTGISQQDSILNIPSYFALNQTDKFRNQFVIITLAVPVGKKIIIHRTSGYSNKIFLGFDNDDFDEYHNGYDWNFDEEYIMTKDGLKSTHIDNDDDDNEDIINNSKDSIDAAKDRIEKQQKKLDEEKDRLKKINDEKKQNLEKQLQDLKNDSEKINAVNVKFESPLLLLGKALLHTI